MIYFPIEILKNTNQSIKHNQRSSSAEKLYIHSVLNSTRTDRQWLKVKVIAHNTRNNSHKREFKPQTGLTAVLQFGGCLIKLSAT